VVSIRKRKLPTIPLPPRTGHAEFDRWLQKMYEHTTRLAGQSDSIDDTVVLWEDLRYLGFVNALPGRRRAHYISPAIPKGVIPPPDLTPPPLATLLTLTPTINSVIVQWDGYLPNNPLVAYAEIARSATDSVTSAGLLATVTKSLLYLDNSITNNNTYYYWVRTISPAGLYSPWTASASVSLTDTAVSVVDTVVTQLSNQQTNGGGTTLVMNKDRFAIKAPGGSPEYPFIVSTVGGVPKIALNGTTFIPDASITGAKIKAAAIDTVQIDDAAITFAKIEEAAVGTAKIANAAVTSAKIDNLAIDTLNIKNNLFTIPVSATEDDVLVFTHGVSDFKPMAQAYIAANGNPLYVLFSFCLASPSTGTSGSISNNTQGARLQLVRIISGVEVVIWEAHRRLSFNPSSTGIYGWKINNTGTQNFLHKCTTVATYVNVAQSGIYRMDMWVGGAYVDHNTNVCKIGRRDLFLLTVK
jgi:hypothetical protein